MQSESDSQRRAFLKTCGCALAGLAIAPAIGGCEFSHVVESGGDSQTVIMEIDVSGLTKDGDALRTTAKGPDRFPIIVIRRAANDYTTLSSRCPHSQRTISTPVGGVMECPGHNSHFNLDGTVRDGIATGFGPLKVYVNTFDDARNLVLVRG